MICRLSLLGVLSAACPSNALWAQSFVVTTTDDTTDANPGDGVAADALGRTSLRAAIQEANALGGNHTVLLRPNASYALSIQGAGEDLAATGDLDVSANIAVLGRGASIDANGLDRVFDVAAGALLFLADTSLRGGAVVDESGGGIRSAGVLYVLDSRIDGCSATGIGASGGAVFNDGGLFSTFQCFFDNCDATRAGGAIEALGGETNLLRCGFSQNTAGAMPGNGGAMHLTGTGTVFVDRCQFNSNIAASEGGALWNSSGGLMVIERSTFQANQAEGTSSDHGGGALFNAGGAMTVSGSRIMGNTAVMGSGSGGGILNDGGDLFVTDSTFDANLSARAGGAIELVAGRSWVLSSVMTSNFAGPAPGNGGALHVTGAGQALIEDCFVWGNVALAEGGGLWNSATGVMRIADCAIQANTASGAASDQGGGGIYNDGGQMWIEFTSVTANTADGASGSGGGLLNNGGAVQGFILDIAGNASQRAGGGIETNGGSMALQRVSLDRNRTGASPGNGGGLHITGAASVTFDRGAVTNNDAANEGGGLWNSATGTLTVTNTVIHSNTAPIGPQLFNVGGAMVVNGIPIP